MLFTVCATLASCDDDSRTGVQGYSDCIICQGKGSFRGGVRGSCNIPAHGCSGYVSDGNHNCANCAENGFDCHAVNHQYK